jgi:hypothetical protein
MGQYKKNYKEPVTLWKAYTGNITIWMKGHWRQHGILLVP